MRSAAFIEVRKLLLHSLDPFSP